MLLALALLLQSAQATELKVLNLNTWFLRIPGLEIDLAQDIDARVEPLVDAAAAQNPDVIFLQEVWTPGLRNRLAQEFRERGYPYAQFPSAPSVPSAFHCSTAMQIFPNLTLPCTTAELIRAGMTTGLLTVSKYPLTPVAHLSFSEYTRADEVMVAKGAMAATLQTPNHFFLAVNSHIGAVSWSVETCDYDEAESRVRLRQVRELAALLNRLDQQLPHATQLLGVDLNTHHHRYGPSFAEYAPEYDLLFGARARLAEVGPARTSRPTACGAMPAGEIATFSQENPYVSSGSFSTIPSETIDYVGVERNSGWRMADYQVVFGTGTPISDHSGVLVRLIR